MRKITPLEVVAIIALILLVLIGHTVAFSEQHRTSAEPRGAAYLQQLKAEGAIDGFDLTRNERS